MNSTRFSVGKPYKFNFFRSNESDKNHMISKAYRVGRLGIENALSTLLKRVVRRDFEG